MLAYTHPESDEWMTLLRTEDRRPPNRPQSVPQGSDEWFTLTAAEDGRFTPPKKKS